MRTRFTTPATRPRVGKHKALHAAETPIALKRRARRLSETLTALHPDAHCELNHRNAYELIVATILSAQCTDARVNLVTPGLFAVYPTVRDLAQARQGDVQKLIRSTGFYRNKAANVIGMAEAVVARFEGEIPERLEDLVTLPGVGRKTANVVRGNAFGYPGLTVDTHFSRLTQRMYLTESKDPVKIETDLAALIPSADWTMFSHRLIFHGRRVCHARRAACGACPLAADCPSFGLVGPTDAAEAADLVTGNNREHILTMAGLGQEEV